MASGKKIIGPTSLRARIFWSLIPIFCVLFLLLGFVDLYKQRELAKEELSTRAKAMAENLAYSSRLAVLTEDRWLLEAALQSVTGTADFGYVWIYGEKWKPLVRALGKAGELSQLHSEPADNQKNRLWHGREMLSNSVSAGNEKYLEYVVPITSIQSTIPYELQMESGGQKKPDSSLTRERTIGAVRLGLSTNRVDAHLTSTLRWGGWSILLFFWLSTLAIYVFSVRITRPIKQLTRQAKEMSQGMLDQTMPVESRDEIGQLAMAFNDMARSLRNLYSDLERKVVERTKELTIVNGKLAEASEHKSRFLANVNHELRTPLSSIIGYARLLRRETEGQISPLQRENLEDLLRNAERLLGLIDSLLDFARIEAGKVDVRVEPVSVDELIESAVATIEPMLNKNCVRLVRNVPPSMAPLYTDPEKLRQIILNLLTNAVKFTAGGEIRISAWQVNGDTKLAVKDTGIGIDSADLGRIFDEFNRGRLSNGGHYHGTGLGLAIVKKLVEILGGSIAVESAVGKGSTFTVIFPIKGGQATSV